MQLNALFGFLGKSFMSEGEDAAKNAGGVRPPVFGAALAAAFGLGKHSGSEHGEVLSDGEQGAPVNVLGSGAITQLSASTEGGEAAASKNGADSESSVAADAAARIALVPPALSADDGESPGASSNESHEATSDAALSSDGDAAALSPGASSSAPSSRTEIVKDTAAEASTAVPAPAAEQEGRNQSPSGPTIEAERPAATTASSGDLTPAERMGSGAEDPPSRPAPSANRASESLPATEVAPRDRASNPPQTEPVIADRPSHASPGNAASTDALPPAASDGRTSEVSSAESAAFSSARTESTGEALSLATAPPEPGAPRVEGGHAQASPSQTPPDSAQSRGQQIRAADLARAARQPSEPGILRAGEAGTSSASEASNGRPIAVADGAAVLEDGASSDLKPDTSTRFSDTTGRRSDSTARPSTSQGTAATTAPLPDGASSAAVSDETGRPEARPVSDPDHSLSTLTPDGEGTEKSDAALQRTEETVRRMDPLRSETEGDRKQTADKSQTASQNGGNSSQGDPDAFSDRRDRQLAARGNQPAAVETVSSDFETTIDDVALDDLAVEPDIPSNESAFTPEQKSALAGLSATDTAQGAPRSRTPANIAWLRSILSQTARTLPLEQGWKTIEVQLEDGMGTMTVRARRGEDGVSVSVSFSDPQLRSLAEANAHRLQDALRAEYESNVDLSLMSDGSADTPGRRNESAQGRSTSARGTRTGAPSEIDVEAPAALGRPAPAGTRNEWIG